MLLSGTATSAYHFSRSNGAKVVVGAAVVVAPGTVVTFAAVVAFVPLLRALVPLLRALAPDAAPFRRASRSFFSCPSASFFKSSSEGA